ncbi:MAG: hypothetical protein OXF22_08520 [Anaerolineaceae bacterium]|nr:hypothetical protein [Anaerolineaceae bacterium]
MPDPISLMQEVIARKSNAPKWIDAPLGSIKTLSNTHIGDIGQDFLEEWCRFIGFSWERSANRQYPWDAKIEGITFEIKTATEDISENFQFNHIRHHRQYQALFCLGIAPDEILFDAWRKGDVSEGRAGNLVTMDKGSSATFKLTKSRKILHPLSKFECRISNLLSALE